MTDWDQKINRKKADIATFRKKIREAETLISRHDREKIVDRVKLEILKSNVITLHGRIQSAEKDIRRLEERKRKDETKQKKKR